MNAIDPQTRFLTREKGVSFKDKRQVNLSKQSVPPNPDTRTGGISAAGQHRQGQPVLSITRSQLHQEMNLSGELE
ncbi:hypothetical protein TH25_11225 [Thalassospira profundimaris]|uniref:Uncharacterized protein n=1 Tax=Thalassospira profundimaris TaxID=502049 RepID=A0A367XAZ6_9PROT|nr:hypothetical protein TH25_11225 [Thalassospira profundimaris]